jgi:hypothetical protein
MLEPGDVVVLGPVLLTIFKIDDRVNNEFRAATRFIGCGL